MRVRSRIEIDTTLLRDAAEALGTSGTAETVEAALRDVVRHRRRMRILDLRPAIDLVELDSTRAHRSSQALTRQ